MPYQLPCLRHLSIEAGEKRRGVDEQVDSKKARVNDESRVFGLLVYEIDRDIMFIVEIAASLTRERIATRLIVEALTNQTRYGEACSADRQERQRRCSFSLQKVGI